MTPSRNSLWKRVQRFMRFANSFDSGAIRLRNPAMLTRRSAGDRRASAGLPRLEMAPCAVGEPVGFGSTKTPNKLEYARCTHIVRALIFQRKERI